MKAGSLVHALKVCLADPSVYWYKEENITSIQMGMQVKLD